MKDSKTKLPKGATPKVSMSYPQGSTPSAKPSMASQKTNPARRNRSYSPTRAKGAP